MSNQKLMKSAFHQGLSKKLNVCLWHDGSCAEKSIKAHSIQNNGVLDIMAVDGHLIHAKPKLDNMIPALSFEKIGRNDATTFTGLCNTHDTQLFEPIDNHAFSVTDDQQSFLMSYRSVLREMHQQLRGVKRIESAFALAEQSGALPHGGGHESWKEFMTFNAREFEGYLSRFHDAYTNSNWTALEYRSIQIPMPKPSIAAGGVFIPAKSTEKWLTNGAEPVVFNIFPDAANLTVIFAAFDFKPAASKIIDAIFNASDHYQLYLISKMVIKYSELFVINPPLFDTYSNERVDDIIKYYMENGAGSERERESEHLFLF